MMERLRQHPRHQADPPSQREHAENYDRLRDWVERLEKVTEELREEIVGSQ